MSLTQQMSPHGGPPRRRRTLLLVALAVVILIAATVGITLAVSGGGGGGPTATRSSAPAPTRFGIPSPQPARSSTADPTAPLLLPHPARTASNGVPLGFPHTPEGAASAIVRWDSLLVAGDENRQLDALRTVSTPRFTQKEVPAIQEDYRKNPLLPGAWAIATPLGVRILSAENDRVDVAIARSIQVGDVRGALNTVYSTGLNHLLWLDGDWRLDDVTEAPGDLRNPSSNDPRDVLAAGWKEFQLG